LSYPWYPVQSAVPLLLPSKVRTGFEDAHPCSKVRILENPDDSFEGAHPFPRCAPKTAHLRKRSTAMNAYRAHPRWRFDGRGQVRRPTESIDEAKAGFCALALVSTLRSRTSGNSSAERPRRGQVPLAYRSIGDGAAKYRKARAPALAVCSGTQIRVALPYSKRSFGKVRSQAELGNEEKTEPWNREGVTRIRCATFCGWRHARPQSPAATCRRRGGI
jgi:hypothetical protein